MQAAALAEGFLDAPRCVVSAPTASGKTLLALLAIVKNALETGSKAIYVVPLRALAAEKHEDFKTRLAPFGLTVGLSTGDLDSSSEHLHAFDVIVCTSEKTDSLFRHSAPWLTKVGLAVIDEVHLIGDGSRGATLEIVLTKLRESGAKLLCLSATIPNAREIADWLDACLVTSDYRPTRLELGLFDSENLRFADDAGELVNGEAGLVKRALAEVGASGQALVFVGSRRNAEALAKKFAPLCRTFLNEEEAADCALLSARALKAAGQPTSQCRSLAECLASGVAFHHAGLLERQRRAIEEGFKRKRCVKCIVCTTTLAMGIDYPASWVIVRDLKRFNGAFAEFIPALEVAQIVGRAGRPSYDEKGVGVLCCQPREAGAVAAKYLRGALENVLSQLSSEPLLRGHCLGLVAAGHCASRDALHEFFGKTFYASQYGDSGELEEKVDSVVKELEGLGFLREGKTRLAASPLGKRVAELYIDPLTAHAFVEFIAREKKEEFDYFLALNKATEARPLLQVGRDEEQALWTAAQAVLGDAADDDGALARFKSARLLEAWVNEAGEEDVFNNFQVPPGVLHARVRIMEWLSYSLRELCFSLNRTREYAEAKALHRRIKHGVKTELLELCSIRGIGRVRARRLWNAGVRDAEAYAALSQDERKRLLRGQPEGI